MVNQELIKYLEDRFSEGISLTYVKNFLKQNQRYEEGEFDDAINSIITSKKKSSGKVESDQVLIAKEKTRIMFIYSLFLVGVILIVFGFSSMNSRNSSFPKFLGFLMLVIAFVVYLGKENIEKFMEHYKNIQKHKDTRL